LFSREILQVFEGESEVTLDFGTPWVVFMLSLLGVVESWFLAARDWVEQWSMPAFGEDVGKGRVKRQHPET
jgi:hypothetical protein